uniref:Uncharacterized protein n=1 Tax=Arundo donax TaxID=35708 RepID=A0A0A9AHH8_ARUDO
MNLKGKQRAIKSLQSRWPQFELRLN